MTAQKKLLDGIMIAAPCNMGWENMAGDERVRFCNQCSLNVYNLSGMSDQEDEALLQEKGTNLCISLYRRADGTVLTENCPVGLRKLKAKLLSARSQGNRLSRIAAALALLLLGLPASAQNNNNNRMTGGVCPMPPSQQKKDNIEQPMLMGKPAQTMPTPTRPGNNEGHTSSPGADTAAQDLWTQARSYEKAGDYLKAREDYKKAVAAVAKDKHDPKFRAELKKDYARFIKEHKKDIR